MRRTQPPPSGPVSIIPDVAVVDVLTGQITAHQDIVIRGERIAEVRGTSTPRVSPAGETRYVIPGLWDMHVLLGQASPQFPLYIANGVTGVRDMGCDLERIRGWEAAISKGALIGPRIYASGPVISADQAVLTPNDARRAFNRHYDARVDFIQIADLSEPAFEALAEASRHGGLAIAGDLPESISAFQAARERMVSIEHLSGIGLACSLRENELRARLHEARRRQDPGAMSEINSEIIETYDALAGAVLWDLFRRYDVWQTPGLTLWRDTTPQQFEFALRVTGEMARAGVPMLAGTNAGDARTLPGSSLHDELDLLVKAGLTPLQALRSATLEPGRIMRREFGLIRKGYAADLVVLSANPLADISNTRKIEMVVARGRQFASPALERMLSGGTVSVSGI